MGMLCSIVIWHFSLFRPFLGDCIITAFMIGVVYDIFCLWLHAFRNVCVHSALQSGPPVN